MVANPPKILFWDIETSLMEVRTFGLYQDVTNHDMIIKDWHIICSCYKWADDDTVHSLTKVGKQNDYSLCKQLAKVITSADIIVHHNGDKFDVKKLNARLIYHGLSPIPKVLTVDTLKQARSIAKFSSNRLDYLGKFLGLSSKLQTTPNLWPNATDGNKEAIDLMVKYCAQDVRLLESVYYKLRPYMKNHPNHNTIVGTDVNCPVCGEDSLIRRGTTKTRFGVYQRYQCNSCGAWSQGKKNLHTTIEAR